MRLNIHAICHKGLVRDNNEDALSLGGYFLRDDSAQLTVSTPEDGFFYLLVSDGMGGHERGEEASEYTLTQLQERFLAHEITKERFEEDLREAVAAISRTLNERAYAQGQERPMGCTLTGVVWHYGKTWLINAGDSRTYRFRDGILRQLTIDETERGISGNPDAGKYLLNCIGGGCEGLLRITSLDGKLLPGDVLLICSDGLADMASDDAIEQALSGDATATDLFQLACDGGGVDNISIILAAVQ